jgi:hypothetical protein
LKAGRLSEFLQAYMLQATNPASKPFRADMLQEMEATPWQWMPRYDLYDPSRTTRQVRGRGAERTLGVSDRTGKVTVSRLGSKILVHESGGFFWKPDELIADLFASNERHRPVKQGIEKTSLDEWLLQPIRIEMLRRGVSLNVVPMNAPQDRSKEDFIMGLQPFFEARDIVLIGGVGAHAQLVAEIVNFPQGPRDVLNALAYALRMFAGVPMYEDFSGANIAELAYPQGETVFVGWNATPAQVAAVALGRDGRRFNVLWDAASAGVLAEAVKIVAFELRTTFPRARFQTWVPADTFDQWQRIALVPALRQERFTPLRGEHANVARGGLSERIRTTWRNHRLLMVDRKAKGTLNALAAGYAMPVERAGRASTEPEAGTSRLLAEALECMVAILDQRQDTEDGFPQGAHLARNAQGLPYVTANPRAR